MRQNVFISYRRADSAKTTKKLHDALKSSLPAGIDVFYDVDRLDPGGDIRKKIQNALEQSKVLLVVIGRQWVNIGRKRFATEDDHVRFEIEYGLSLRRMCAIPVLVDCASMPAIADLPGRLKSFAYNEAVHVRPAHFSNDVARIVEKITALLRPAIRIGSYRDVELLKWDYADLLRKLILLDLEALDILTPDGSGSDEKGEGNLTDAALTIHPMDPALADSAPGRRYFAQMCRTESVPLAATSPNLRYRQQLSVGGGRAPYTFTLASGALPSGLSLNSVTGEIAGRPNGGGVHHFTAQVMDAAGNIASRRFTINGDEGTPEDWARVFRDYPDTWRLVLNKDDDILGYWHVAPLHRRYLDAVLAGKFAAGEVTSDKLQLFHMFPGTYDVFFVIVALKKDYRIAVHVPAADAAARHNPKVSSREVNDVHRTLFDSFFEALEELIEREVYVRELIADVWSPLGKRFFEHFGLDEIIPCPRDDMLAVCTGRIETIFGRHAQRYAHLVERYRAGMEDWQQGLFEAAAGRT